MILAIRFWVFGSNFGRRS